MCETNRSGNIINEVIIIVYDSNWDCHNYKEPHHQRAKCKIPYSVCFDKNNYDHIYMLNIELYWKRYCESILYLVLLRDRNQCFRK